MNEPVDLGNKYAELAAVNVGRHMEKKGKYSYLSWAWAVDTLLRLDPEANWSYGDPMLFGETMMVFCTVTAFGVARKMQLPVINAQNKAIPNPNAFDVNTAMQRCLVKAIALHGLGLYIYAGEDVPSVIYAEGEDAPELDNAIVSAFEGASSLDDIAKTWNAIPKDDRPRFRSVKDSAIARIKSAVAEAA